jgi:hypothetical protein
MEHQLMNAANELEVMKEAARRLEAFFAERGLNVKHAVALEALSASLGARNWRTVRDKLSEPASVVERVVLPEDIEPGKRFLVRGVSDDSQPYAKYFAGSNTRVALYSAIFQERLLNDNELEVVEIVDRESGQAVRFDNLSSANTLKHSVAFRMALDEMRRHLKPFEELKVSEVSDWHGDLALTELFGNPLELDQFCTALDLVLDTNPGLSGELDGVLGFEDSRGRFWSASLGDFFDYLVEALGRYESQFSDAAREALFQVYAMHGVCKIAVCAVYAWETAYGY